MGITKLLESSRKDNEELERYLAEKSYESASLGETSADELAVASGSESTGVEVYRTTQISNQYEDAKEIAAHVDQYEKSVVQEHLNLDLYRRKGKTYS